MILSNADQVGALWNLRDSLYNINSKELALPMREGIIGEQEVCLQS